jgi:Leucine-rich repeat (LRR) protein
MMTELRNVDLGNNKLTAIPANLFVDNPKLERLVLMNNQIKSVDIHLFDYSIAFNKIWMGSNICIDSNMQTANELTSFKRSIVPCVTNYQRMEVEDLRSLPSNLQIDFEQMEKSWHEAKNFTEKVHEYHRRQLDLTTAKLNNLTNWVENAQKLDDDADKTISDLKQRQLLLDLDGKYYQAETFVEGKILLLLALQITSFILLLTIMSLIIYGMWKIKQKASSLEI